MSKNINISGEQVQDPVFRDLGDVTLKGCHLMGMPVIRDCGDVTISDCRIYLRPGEKYAADVDGCGHFTFRFNEIYPSQAFSDAWGVGPQIGDLA